MRRFRLFLGQYSYVVKYDKWLTHIHTFQSDSELWSELSFYTFLIFFCPKFAKARHERELNGGGWLWCTLKKKKIEWHFLWMQLLKTVESETDHLIWNILSNILKENSYTVWVYWPRGVLFYVWPKILTLDHNMGKIWRRYSAGAPWGYRYIDPHHHLTHR